MADSAAKVVTTSEKEVQEFVHSCGIDCAICKRTMSLMRGRMFPICDECLKDLREIINERRKPNEVDDGR